LTIMRSKYTLTSLALAISLLQSLILRAHAACQEDDLSTCFGPLLQVSSLISTTRMDLNSACRNTNDQVRVCLIRASCDIANDQQLMNLFRGLTDAQTYICNEARPVFFQYLPCLQNGAFLLVLSCSVEYSNAQVIYPNDFCRTSTSYMQCLKDGLIPACSKEAARVIITYVHKKLAWMAADIYGCNLYNPMNDISSTVSIHETSFLLLSLAVSMHLYMHKSFLYRL